MVSTSALAREMLNAHLEPGPVGDLLTDLASDHLCDNLDEPDTVLHLPMTAAAAVALIGRTKGRNAVKLTEALTCPTASAAVAVNDRRKTVRIAAADNADMTVGTTADELLELLLAPSTLRSPERATKALGAAKAAAETCSPAALVAAVPSLVPAMEAAFDHGSSANAFRKVAATFAARYDQDSDPDRQIADVLTDLPGSAGVLFDRHADPTDPLRFDAGWLVQRQLAGHFRRSELHRPGCATVLCSALDTVNRSTEGFADRLIADWAELSADVRLWLVSRAYTRELAGRKFGLSELTVTVTGRRPVMAEGARARQIGDAVRSMLEDRRSLAVTGTAVTLLLLVGNRRWVRCEGIVLRATQQGQRALAAWAERQKDNDLLADLHTRGHDTAETRIAAFLRDDDPALLYSFGDVLGAAAQMQSGRCSAELFPRALELQPKVDTWPYELVLSAEAWEYDHLVEQASDEVREALRARKSKELLRNKSVFRYSEASRGADNRKDALREALPLTCEELAALYELAYWRATLFAEVPESLTEEQIAEAGRSDPLLAVRYAASGRIPQSVLEVCSWVRFSHSDSAEILLTAITAIYPGDAEAARTVLALADGWEGNLADLLSTAEHLTVG